MRHGFFALASSVVLVTPHSSRFLADFFDHSRLAADYSISCSIFELSLRKIQQPHIVRLLLALTFSALNTMSADFFEL